MMHMALAFVMLDDFHGFKQVLVVSEQFVEFADAVNTLVNGTKAPASWIVPVLSSERSFTVRTVLGHKQRFLGVKLGHRQWRNFVAVDHYWTQ